MKSNNSSNDRRRLWMRIGDDFRQACLLRREGKAEEANELLEKKLPQTIAAWARLSGLPEADRRERLNDLFETEQKRVDDIWLSHQIVLRQMRDILIPSLCLQVAEEVREVMDLQTEQLTAALTKISRAPAAALPASARSAEPQPPLRIVPLPVVMPTERKSAPNFDDLPLIIDDLITSSIESSKLDSRIAALV
jgi:hypothetical protein